MTAMQLDRDVTCLNCGYNLRGIRASGDCPECGMSIAVALREDRLADAPRPWRMKLRRGSWLLLLGVAVSFPVPNVGLAIAAAGLWLLTARQPGRTEPRHDLLVRIFSRGTMVPGAVGLCLLLNGPLIVAWRFRELLRYDWSAYDPLLIAFAGYFGIGVAAMAQHLRALAERTADAAAVGRCGRLFKVWIAAGGVVVALGLAFRAYQWAGEPWNQYTVTTTLLALALPAGLLTWLWYETLRATHHFHRTVKSAIPDLATPRS